MLWRWSEVGSPGVYVVSRDEPVYAIAAAVPPEESDLRTLPAKLLQGRLADGRKVDYRAAGQADDSRDDRWTWFAVACVVCLFLELAVLKSFRT